MLAPTLLSSRLPSSRLRFQPSPLLQPRTFWFFSIKVPTCSPFSFSRPSCCFICRSFSRCFCCFTTFRFSSSRVRRIISFVGFSFTGTLSVALCAVSASSVSPISSSSCFSKFITFSLSGSLFSSWCVTKVPRTSPRLSSCLTAYTSAFTPRKVRSSSAFPSSCTRLLCLSWPSS